jgi:hypothetical protein
MKVESYVLGNWWEEPDYQIVEAQMRQEYFGSSSRLWGCNRFLDQWESDTLDNVVQKLIPGRHLRTDSQSDCSDSPQR